ncbi:Hypothetical protein A7982_13613 [Minicystis rosea]|nr:Hypothetical protein A7982_13613 [Minicystis rosea]
MTHRTLLVAIVAFASACETPDPGFETTATSEEALTSLWSKQFGDAMEQAGTAVTADPSGNVIAAGQFRGTTSFGGGNLTSAGGYDAYVAKLDGSGAHVWSKRFGNSSDQYVKGVATDTSGNVLVTGNFNGTIDLGTGTLVSAGGTDIWLAKLDTAGAGVWARRFGDASAQSVAAIAVTSTGNIVIAGQFQGTVDFGGGPLVSAGSADIFVAEYDAIGGFVWAKRFGDSCANQSATAITVDASGNVIIAGGLAGTVNFGGANLTTSSCTDVNAFVAKFNASGVHQWSKAFGDTAAQLSTGLGVDSLGNVYLTGTFGGTTDLGGGPMVSAGLDDIFLARFAPTGGLGWSKRIGGTSADLVRGLATNASGKVRITGKYAGTVDFGGGNLTSAGSSDIFLAEYATSGAFISASRFGDAASQDSNAVAFDASDDALITGQFAGTVNFGAGTLSSSSGNDIFVAKFTP